ncbi:hypothetical protein BGZ58_000401 [Dissophora ornata]|nr:hypothetical protein BGZ58_000401 [Dissophora ornata]
MLSNSNSISVTGNTAVNDGPSPKNPFMAGSLLQQRAEAEKQEIENMKQQLRMREQAGVLGARNMNFMSDNNTLQTNSNSNSNGNSTPSSQNYQHSGRGRDISASGSALSLSSAASEHSPHQQYQHQPPQQPLPLTSQTTAPKFGGPGTLIEKGEARAAELLRSKSAGTGLLRPSHANAAGAGTGYRRTRSKSRGPAEDRVPFGGATPPNSRSPDASPGGGPSVPSVPQGPLLYFEHPDAMIQPGLLLSRAKSAKQVSSPSPSSSPSANSARSPGGGRSKVRQASAGGILNSSQTLIGQIDQRSQSSQTQGGQSGGGPGARTRTKPLVDLGNTNASQGGIRPGLLKGNGINGSGSTVPRHARSPTRRQKPLLEF